MYWLIIGEMDTGEMAQRFLSARTAQGLSDNTLQSYKYRLGVFERHFEYLPEHPEQIESFLAQMGPSQENRETYYRLLRNFYRWLHRRQIVESNPIELVDPPRLRRTVARSFTNDELRRILTFHHRPCDFALISVLLDTGLRLGEAVSIISPEQFKENTVIVEGKVGEREVPISSQVSSLAREHVPWPWASADAAGTAVSLALKKAGIRGKRTSAQTIRHTFVRMWEEDESVLVDIMGWTSPRMLKIYKPYSVKRAVEQHGKNNLYGKLTRE